MILSGPSLQLVTFEAEHSAQLAYWAYRPEYKEFFRHAPRMLTMKEMANYPALVGGDVFAIYLKEEKKHIGIVQLIPDINRTGRSFYVGILIDKEHQKNRYTTELFTIVLDYGFNKRGFNKSVVEVIADKPQIKDALLTAGYRFEGTLYDECFLDGEYKNEWRFSATAKYFNKHYGELAKEFHKLY